MITMAKILKIMVFKRGVKFNYDNQYKTCFAIKLIHLFENAHFSLFHRV